MTAIVHHPRAVELIERAKLRKQVARAVSRLIAILDELDSDPEAEPWLGAGVVLYPEHDNQRLWARCANDDREAEDEHGGDILDEGEETLGWNENVRQVGLSPNTADADLTASERQGCGFVRGGPEDCENDSSAEPDNRCLPKSRGEHDLWFPALSTGLRGSDDPRRRQDYRATDGGDEANPGAAVMSKNERIERK